MSQVPADAGAQPLAVLGDMTVYTVGELKRRLLRACARGDVSLDLGGVAEFDTAGVQLLLLMQREAAARGYRVALSRSSEAVTAVLAAFGLGAVPPPGPELPS